MSDSEKHCPSCHEPPARIVAANELAFTLEDAYPVNAGHLLVCPYRHVASFFDLTNEETKAIFELLHTMKRHCDAEFQPDGYNIGVNVGDAAGQTIQHVHVHLIPRYDRDVDDPRGGVRHVIPSRGNYLANGFSPPR